MSFKLKIKKMSIIAGAITIMTSSFGSFAAGPSGESLPHQTMGISEVNDLTEQTSDDATSFFSEVDSVSSDVEDEGMSTNSSSRTININNPGKYRLVGAGSVDSSSESQDPNETIEIININDRIVISGDGDYNVTMENVNIVTKPNDLLETTPIQIKQNANVNLTLKGKNVLNNEFSSNIGLYADETSTLTITESSEGSSLHVAGLDHGICSHGTITIKSGIVEAKGKNYGMSCGKLTIDGGNITSSGNHGISGVNITIKSGIVEAKGKGFGMAGINLTIEGGNITSSGIYGIRNTKIWIKGGNIKANGNDVGIACRYINMHNGTIETIGRDCGICIEVIAGSSITGGNITSSGKITGIEKFDPISIKILAGKRGNRNIILIEGMNVKTNGNYVVYDINNIGTIEINTTK